jgi:hypothetical protein
LPLGDQFLFLLNVIHGRNGRGERLQLVLGGVPLTLIDQLLDLGELLRGELHGVVARRLLLPEQHGAQPIQRIARAGVGDYRAETAETKHRGRDRSQYGRRHAPALAGCRGAVQGDDGVARGDDSPHRRVADLVAPAGKNLREFGLARIGRVHRLLECQRVDEPVRAVDLVERRIAPVGSPASEVRHSHAPSR